MKQKQNKIDLRKDLRKDWKDEAENHIINLQDEIDSLELPAETNAALQKLFGNFKLDLNKEIDLFEVTPAIAVQNNSCFVGDILEEIDNGKISLSDEERETMVEITYKNIDGQFVKIGSIAEQMKLDDFLADLEANPYQLKLIA